MKKLTVFNAIILVALPAQLFAQNIVPVEVNVDTGSHTCTKIGQDHKAYQDVFAGKGRYFVNPALDTVSKFGDGNCVYTSDGGAYDVRYEKFKFTDADGEVEWMDKPVNFVVRAYADCTNNVLKLASRVGTACRFTATSKKGMQ